MRRVRRTPSMAVLASLFTLPAATVAGADVVETRALEESILVDGAAELEVVVDNVFGSIRVAAHDRNTVEMTATETIRADSQSDLDRARAEVGLRTEREDGRLAFRVRRLDDDCACDCRCRWNGYVAAYDIELLVPRAVAVDLSTVTDGEIVVDDVRGDFRVANVNGPVTLRGLRGSGRATTVNGTVLASFDRSPTDATSFETVNGEIEVAFPSDLSADLELKTMRGDIWTDFDVTPLPSSLVGEQTRDGGRLVIRAARRSAVRVASGGPTHSFETLNGDIYVREVP